MTLVVIDCPPQLGFLDHVGAVGGDRGPRPCIRKRRST